ncbi:uncharacterized protein LOC119190711 [Manduca sexta]|uniref:uncharacterized protein LOC119190711 n=1 Tax=Manduca sexta TaxID=7130 RepID=UPI0018903B77|nr:uncharacterized protein LOC119190711 [Manduca sexta]
MSQLYGHPEKHCRSAEVTCRRCGEVGHHASDCSFTTPSQTHRTTAPYRGNAQHDCTRMDGTWLLPATFSPESLLIGQINLGGGELATMELPAISSELGLDIVLIQEQYSTSRLILQHGSLSQAGIYTHRRDIAVSVLPEWCNDYFYTAHVADLDLILVSAYFKYSDPIDPHAEHLTRLLSHFNGQRIIVCADCNAHSPKWHCSVQLCRGRRITADRRQSTVEDLITAYSLQVANAEGQPVTFCTVNGESNVDVTLYSRSCHVDEWRVHIGASTSDHRLITFKVSQPTNRRARKECSERSKLPPGFRDRGVDWGRFRTMIHLRMGYLDMSTSAAEASERFTDIVVYSARATLGVRRRKKEVGYEWWTPELDRLRRRCGSSRRAWQRTSRAGSPAEEYAGEVIAESGNVDSWGLAYRVSSGRSRPPENVVTGIRFAKEFTETVDEAMHTLA